MGRYSTGTWTVYESRRIELPYLLKHGFIRKGCEISFSLSWSDQHGQETSNANFKSSYLSDAEKQYLQVSYTITKRDGSKSNQNSKVYLFEQNSNLGKGKVLYFLCPQTRKKCRKLYQAYGSDIFKCREAYKHRLYYDCQLASKLSKYNDTYWRIDSHLDKIKRVSAHGNRTYRGKPTKAALRYERLFKKQCLMDELRWTLGAPRSLRGMLQEDGF